MKDFVMYVNRPNNIENENGFVSCRLTYVPPYERFDGIRQIQLAVREKVQFSDDGITVSIDFSEWIGHEKEEYFTSLIRFLYDHRNKWKYAFILEKAQEWQYRKMYIAIRTYLQGEIFINDRWSELKDLEAHLKECLPLDSNASKVLAKLLLTAVPEDYRNDDFLRALVNEINMDKSARTITIRHLQKYAEESDSLIAMTVPHNLILSVFRNEKEERDGK